MWFTYVLHSKKDGRLYIGFARDVETRLAMRQLGRVEATKHRQPLSLIYYEAYSTEEEAKRREKFLKGGNGRIQLKNQIPTTLKNLGYRFK